MNKINTFRDNHVHIFHHSFIDAKVVFGRREIPEWVMKTAITIGEVVSKKTHLLPDEWEKMLDFLLGTFGFDDEVAGIREMIRLFYTPVPKQVEIIQKMWKANGITGGNILIPAVGDYFEATLQITAACAAHSNIKVFAPLTCASMPGVSGIKYYPAVEGRNWTLTMSATEKPIIAHCSPGGIRAGNRSLSTERSYNKPGWVNDALNSGYPVRICLAHAGGEAEFLKFCEPVAGRNSALENLLLNTADGELNEYPGSKVFLDTAFHESQASNRYRNAVAAMPACGRGRVLLGSDWPLHLGQYSYAQWARDTRAAWGEVLDEVAMAEKEFGGEG